jgi:hypothetical protein
MPIARLERCVLRSKRAVPETALPVISLTSWLLALGKKQSIWRLGELMGIMA